MTYTIRVVDSLSKNFGGAKVETVDVVRLGARGRVLGGRNVNHPIEEDHRSLNSVRQMSLVKGRCSTNLDWKVVEGFDRRTDDGVGGGREKPIRVTQRRGWGFSVLGKAK